MPDDCPWWAVYYEGNINIIPALDWRLACMSANKVISVHQAVKFLTKKRYDINKKNWVQQKVQDINGYWNPIILGGLAFTTDFSICLSPEEAALKLKSLVDTHLKCVKTLEECQAVYDAAQDYLRHVSPGVAAAFSNLYNTVRDAICKTNQNPEAPTS